MDKLKIHAAPSIHSKLRLLLLSTLVISVFVILTVMFRSSLHTVEIKRTDILIGEVKQGTMQLNIDGFGGLYSPERQLLTAVNSGVVTEILHQPGDRLKADDIILRLRNPALEQQLKTDQQNLASEQANLRKLMVEQKREMLTETSKLTELKSQLEIASLKRQSKQQLQKQGIISKLEFIETQLEEKQLINNIALSQSKISQLKDIHNESINIQQLKISQQQDKVNTSQTLLEDMNVKATQAGILQTLPVELGQRIDTGMEVASVGRTDNLIARINISQVQAAQIKLGNPAVVSIWPDTFSGKVLRVDPLVKDKMVMVEIGFDQPLPDSVKPNQDVNAQITTQTIENTLFVKRPANLQSGETVYLYRLNDNYQQARRQRLTLGEMSSNLVQIVSGASAGERFIISDLNYLDNDVISVH
ncbi:efflux RND transporter periplasmic adaptor subunit [Neptunicella marina]|uniref:HlyD family efflux transporter periplasmic adaptor subunit n=1 Tax=Neptunicella marina TaxID=2125989 RepID=A0A8J6ITD8_9ALTE|nr:HlyD family efflux transporter periplasmic adaptor subunit [Neptunicella marina]MBC3765542.1 HlyD family efflux transporter periplasmic adaptor subunit [Neptunicella marina]